MWFPSNYVEEIEQTTSDKPLGALQKGMIDLTGYCVGKLISYLDITGFCVGKSLEIIEISQLLGGSV